MIDLVQFEKDFFSVCKNPIAFAAYSFAISKPVVSKSEIAERFNCGGAKLTAAIKELKSLGLIQDVIARDEFGRIKQKHLAAIIAGV
jgi:hypothetical protein